MNIPNKHFHIDVAQFLREFCKSYKENALTNFMHDITYTEGQISMLVNHPEIISFYFKNQIPTLCTDETGRTLGEGIYLNKMLENSHKDCSVLMPLMTKVGNQFGQHYGKNSLHVVVREANCQHLYSLFFDLDEMPFIHWVLNNGNFIPDLIANYNEKAKDIILQARFAENRIELPHYYEVSPIVNDERIRVFHKNLHIPIHLSKQQGNCLRILMQGKSAKEIAQVLKLSPRTVEHYLENIRRLLGCNSNKDLIVSYYSQFVGS